MTFDLEKFSVLDNQYTAFKEENKRNKGNLNGTLNEMHFCYLAFMQKMHLYSIWVFNYYRYFTHPVIFFQVGKHYNGGRLILPNHTPEVSIARWDRSLCSNVSVLLIVTLN